MARRQQGSRGATSHRPRRDGQKAHELADLKRENHQLKRVIARLRKRVDQLELLDDPSDEAQPTEVALPEPTPVSPVPLCPLCGSAETTEFTTPAGRRFFGCRACKEWRGAA